VIILGVYAVFLSLALIFRPYESSGAVWKGIVYTASPSISCGPMGEGTNEGENLTADVLILEIAFLSLLATNVLRLAEVRRIRNISAWALSVLLTAFLTSLILGFDGWQLFKPSVALLLVMPRNSLVFTLAMSCFALIVPLMLQAASGRRLFG
jgi:hypothetical protein